MIDPTPSAAGCARFVWRVIVFAVGVMAAALLGASLVGRACP